MKRMENPDCSAAVLRFHERLDMDKVRKIIDEIPTSAYGIEVITPVQKEYYKKMFEIMLEKGIAPVVEKILAFSSSSC